MAYALESVNAVSQTYLLNEKRYNYTTPKSFLELIALYSKLLTEKMNEMSQKIYRLDNGLICLVQCSEQVDTLKVRTAHWNPATFIFSLSHFQQDVLSEQEKSLKQKNESSDKLISIICTENIIVHKEKSIGNQIMYDYRNVK